MFRTNGWLLTWYLFLKITFEQQTIKPTKNDLHSVKTFGQE